MVRCFLTTFDNPYNPYEQFEQWYQYDMDHGYNSSGLLMRLAQTSSQFTDNENAYEIEKAINKIVANDPANIYKKLKIDTPSQIAPVFDISPEGKLIFGL